MRHISLTAVCAPCFPALLLPPDFLHDYIFLTVGRVGSSTDLIAQHVEYVQQDQKRETVLDCVKMVDVSQLLLLPLAWLLEHLQCPGDLQRQECRARAGSATAQQHMRVVGVIGLSGMQPGMAIDAEHSCAAVLNCWQPPLSGLSQAAQHSKQVRTAFAAALTTDCASIAPALGWLVVICCCRA